MLGPEPAHREYLERGGFPDIEAEIAAHPDVYLESDVAYRSLAVPRYNAIQAQGGCSGRDQATAEDGLSGSPALLADPIQKLRGKMRDLRGADYKLAKKELKKLVREAKTQS